MNVKVREVTITDRMRLFHDFFRPADSDFYFDLPNIVRSGHDFKDSIAPDYMTFRKDFYEMGKHVGRVLFLRDYASFIQDEMITELSELPRNMMISINLMPIPTDEVIKEINRRMMAIESDIAQITHRQNAHQNYNATIPFPLLQRREHTKGRFTHVYIDEIYLFFTNHAIGSGQKNINLYSGEFLYKCWKRFRKYGACLTGITQNFEECLKSDTARLMFANSEFVLMFNQASTDRKKLADVFESSETQMDYVNHSPVGHGLIKVGGSMVPFVNEFPKDTELYRLISTNPNEH